MAIPLVKNSGFLVVGIVLTVCTLLGNIPIDQQVEVLDVLCSDIIQAGQQHPFFDNAQAADIDIEIRIAHEDE
jgi:hypothetical protein